jgi:arginyl-tRNA synthetase
MKQQIIDLLADALDSLGVKNAEVKLDYPENPEHGDFSTNVAMVYAKQLKISPKKLAEKIIERLNEKLKGDSTIEQGNSLGIRNAISDITIAGPGFINFKLKDEVFAGQIIDIAQHILLEGVASSLKSPPTGGRIEEKLAPQADVKQVLIEYTDPNTFKAFHIGHIMSNTIGESLSRLIEFSGNNVVRICYPSDIGLHIAKSIWAMQQHLGEIPSEAAAIEERTTFLGKMYVEGTKSYDADPLVKNEIDELNQAIYDKSDEAVNDLYDKGRQWSLGHFDMFYELLGTKFDEQIFESEMAPVGLKVVKEHIKQESEGKIGNDGKSDGRGVFEESDGAIVFKGEEFGLHTRVFVNSRGLPTYETKDVGLNMTKFEKYPDASQSIIVTANEQNDYFKVLIKVLSLIDQQNSGKTMHIGHGMLRFASGKMSSRTGNVVTADSLIGDMKKLVMEKIADRKFSPDEADEIADTIAVGAIKYTILRQAIGGNVVFDSAASISFEGDSGPYLQYSAVRAYSILEKAGTVEISEARGLPEKVGLLEKLIVRFNGIADRAREEYAPQIMANYLIALAGAFNAFYANQTIIDEKDPLSAYRIELTKAFLKTMTEGLWLLGIKVPKRM